MYWVGIDQSLTATGIVVRDYSGNIIDMKLIHTVPGTLSEEDRIKYIGDEIRAYLSLFDISAVFIEGLSYASKADRNVRVLAGLFYHILIMLGSEGYDYEYYPPTSVKKFAGKGNWKKTDMLLAVPDEHLFEIKAYESRKTKGLYDLVDAYWICGLGMVER